MAKKERNSDDIPSLASQGRCDHQADNVETKSKVVYKNTVLETTEVNLDCNTCNTSYKEFR